MHYRRLGTIAALAAALVLTATACNDDDNVVLVEPTSATTTAQSGPDTTETEATVSDASTPDTSAPAPTEPADSADSAPSSTTGECAAEPTDETAEELLVGLTEDEATEAAEACDWILRVVRRDGEDLPMTLDLRPNRVNVEVTGDEVTAVVNIA